MADVSHTMDVLAYDPTNFPRPLALSVEEVVEHLKKDPKIVDAYVDERGRVRAVVRVEVGVEMEPPRQLLSPAYK